MVWLWFAGFVVVALVMPGAEVLLAMGAWFAFVVSFAFWIAGLAPQETAALAALGVLALGLRAVRLRVAARLW